ncbi:MAG TPA: restriction endonuclease subunit S, partial [Elusimicrobia bacterium]|nr:restriction endonuclease subunit S [Elusimicrobiota bacterium]
MNQKILNIPKGWGVHKTADLFEVETGTTPSTKRKDYWKNGTINWFTPADLRGLDNKIEIDNSERKITELALKDSNLTLMPAETIILSTRAPVGYVALFREAATFNQGCKGLTAKDKKQTCPKFYCYYLLNKRQALQNLSSGSTFKELAKDAL